MIRGVIALSASLSNPAVLSRNAKIQTYSALRFSTNSGPNRSPLRYSDSHKSPQCKGKGRYQRLNGSQLQFEAIESYLSVKKSHTNLICACQVEAVLHKQGSPSLDDHVRIRSPETVFDS